MWEGVQTFIVLICDEGENGGLKNCVVSWRLLTAHVISKQEVYILSTKD